MTPRSLGARLIPGAAATALPMLVANPDVAITPFEWLELLAFPVLLTGFAWWAGSAVARPFGVSRLRGRIAGALLAWVVCLSVAGAASDGLRGGAIVIGAGALAGAAALYTQGRVSGFARSMGVVAVVWISAIGVASSFAPNPSAPERPLVIVGLDGASWAFIDRFRAEGRLPTFDRLAAEGARGNLDTVRPLLSPALWTTIASGLRPDQHGVRDFWTSSRHVRAKRLWEIADESGLRSGVFGFLVTWPPRKQGGFMVPGFLAGDTQTIPPELSFLKELEIAEQEQSSLSWADVMRLAFAALRHGGTLGTLNTALASFSGVAGDLDRELGERLTGLAARTDAFCHMIRADRPDLAIFYHNQIDAVGHLYFRYFAPDAFPDVDPADASRWGEAIPRMYEASDRLLARIAHCVPPSANLLVVSDHGQRPASAKGRPELVVKSSALLERLELSASVRAANVGGMVFLRAVSPSAPLAPALEKLRGVVAESDGAALFELREHDATSAVLRAPDRPLAGRARVGTDFVELGELLAPARRISGAHTQTAMLLLHGPDIAGGQALPRASMLDVTPTALALLGLPAADDMPGRLLEEALRPESRTRATPPRIASYGMPADVVDQPAEIDPRTRKQLQSLGYEQ